ncbi:MAG: hypothetical protein JNL74_20390 [Fibrobacteres bacterium]|nr:hypothetical protein [Fibrobacterota bacterium]
MRYTLSAAILACSLSFVIFSCQNDSKNTTQPGNTNNSESDPSLAYMIAHQSATDSIDSTGTYFKRGDTIQWVIKIDSVTFDTMPLVVNLRGDTAEMKGIEYSDFPTLVTITGTRIVGSSTLFEGSLWRAASVKTTSTAGEITAQIPNNNPIYLYFCTTNNKVYSLSSEDATEELVATLILQCPYAMFGAELATGMGVTIDTVKSSCDTLFAKKGTPPFVLSYYAVSNFDSLTLDVYLGTPGASMLAQRLRLTQ